MQRVEGLISSFGLQNQANDLIGTPIRKGISGGQKRRVTLASQLITSPRIVFLDEPTSGLDSHASFEVINFVRNICKKHSILVIASIHQPSTATFNLFDKLLLLSLGSTIYNGPVSDVTRFFAAQGCEIPTYTNPAEHVLELVNTDFATDQAAAESKLRGLQEGWEGSTESRSLNEEIESVKSGTTSPRAKLVEDHERLSAAQKFLVPFTLVHRNFIKSYRDVIAYGIRIAMYLGLAIMMGTVWLRLAADQESIIPITNAIVSTLPFVTVAYSVVLRRSLYEFHGSGIHSGLH
jgi:ABC-type multidrug transport system ATPase subunit